jgi:hypothetical protein
MATVVLRPAALDAFAGMAERPGFVCRNESARWVSDQGYRLFG